MASEMVAAGKAHQKRSADSLSRFRPSLTCARLVYPADPKIGSEFRAGFDPRVRHV